MFYIQFGDCMFAYYLNVPPTSFSDQYIYNYRYACACMIYTYIIYYGKNVYPMLLLHHVIWVMHILN